MFSDILIWVFKYYFEVVESSHKHFIAGRLYGHNDYQNINSPRNWYEVSVV